MIHKRRLPGVFALLAFATIAKMHAADFEIDRKYCAACLSSIESFSKTHSISLSGKNFASLILNSQNEFEKSQQNIELLRTHQKLKESLTKNGSLMIATYRTSPSQLGGVIAFICDSRSGEVLAFKTLK